MRLFLLTFLFAGNLLAQSLPPGQLAPLYLHLVEVNEQWLEEASPTGLLEETSFASNVDRIQMHFQLVEKALRKRSTNNLSPQQQQKRMQALGVLYTYWQQKEFPTNSISNTRTPIFIDHNDTPCAVGALLLASDKQALAYKIQLENNYAFLNELLIYPALVEWAEENGFSLQELAWIQPPAYNFVGVITVSPFGNNLGVAGGEVLDLEVAEEEIFFAGNFTQIDGTDARYLAAWDGTQFRTFPPLNGAGIEEVSVDESSGDIYAIGQFYNFTDEPGVVLLVRLRNGVWEPMVNSQELSTNFDNFGESIKLKDIVCQGGYCYLGGNFTEIKGQFIKNLAVYDIANESWTPFTEDWSLVGAVNDMAITNDSLLIGGAFRIVSPDGEDIGEYMTLLHTENRSILKTAPSDGDDYTGQYVEAVDIGKWGHNSLTIRHTYRSPDGWGIGAGFFYYLSFSPLSDYYTSTSTPKGVNASLSMAYGKFQRSSSAYGSSGMFGIGQGSFSLIYFPTVWADGVVTQVAEFQGEIYVVGEFMSLDSIENINHLAKLRLYQSAATTTHEVTSLDPTASTDGLTIFLDHLPVDAKTTSFELFDQQGRLVWSQQLPTLTSSARLVPQNLPAAAYVYRIVADNQFGVGQIVLVGSE